VTFQSRVLRAALLAGALSAAVWASWVVANETYNTDFPVAYRAGRIALDPGLSNAQLYDRGVSAAIPIPEVTTAEVEKVMHFNYPATAAYLLATVTWLPYFPAKAAMVFINIMSYLLALGFFAASLGVSPRANTRLVALSCLWLPFLETLRFAQINAVLLLFITGAAIAARRGHRVLSALCIALASIFKLFPLGLVAFLGWLDWRIGLSALLFFTLMLIGQPIQPWLSSIAEAVARHLSFSHVILGTSDLSALAVYTACVLAAGVVLARYGRRLGAEWLAAFGVVTILLASPMTEYYHLTLAVPAYAYLATREEAGRTGWVMALLSIALVSMARFCDEPSSTVLVWSGLAVTWVGLALAVLRRNREEIEPAVAAS